MTEESRRRSDSLLLALSAVAIVLSIPSLPYLVGEFFRHSSDEPWLGLVLVTLVVESTIVVIVVAVLVDRYSYGAWVPVLTAVVVVEVFFVASMAIGTVVLGISESPPYPMASFDSEYTPENDTFRIVHQGGDSFTPENTDRLVVVVDPENGSRRRLVWTAGCRTVEAGDAVRIQASAGDRVRVRWSETQRTQVVFSWVVNGDETSPRRSIQSDRQTRRQRTPSYHTENVLRTRNTVDFMLPGPV